MRESASSTNFLPRDSVFRVFWFIIFIFYNFEMSIVKF